MSLTNSRLIRLSYGDGGEFSCELEADRVVASLSGPPPLEDLDAEIRGALRSPLDFPPLAQAVIPDDRVALALDAGTPGADRLLAAVWDVLEEQGVRPENVTVIESCADRPPLHDPRVHDPRVRDPRVRDPRRGLPAHARKRMIWRRHEPSEEACAYLASSLGGERVYLAREVIDADVAISVGTMGHDALIGYRGTNSVFYPGLSTADAVARSRGQGHSELGPDDERPLRQFIDEIGWLLGTQFTLQVVPAAGEGVAHVLAGAVESVYRRGRQLVAEEWFVRLAERPEILVAAIDAEAGGHGWTQLGAALETARNLVQNGGKIVLLTDLDDEPGPGLELIRHSDDPRETIRPLRQQSPPDLVSATQLAGAVDWADVYLLSRLDGELVDELFMVRLSGVDEAARLLRQGGNCVFLGSAQH
ncbi:MAG: lactate racemase domain-containing protein, partial [Planctomycetaceae bacterium]